MIIASCKKRSLLLILLAILFLSSNGQDTYRLKLCKTTLLKDSINKSVKYNRIDRQYGNIIYQITYLGLIRGLGKEYKVVTISVFSGLSNHATNEICLFNKTNEFIGKYRGLLLNELPRKIENNKLVFQNAKGTECNHHLRIYVDFGHGIPKEISINCKEQADRVYSFINQLKE